MARSVSNKRRNAAADSESKRKQDSGLGNGAREDTAKEDTKETAAEQLEEQGTKDQDYYAVLGVDRSASQVDIRKAYHRLALKLHPDKNPNDESAKAAFQSLQSVFSVLSDPERRKVYDETGCTEEGLTGDQFNNLYQFYRSMYGELTEDRVAEFESEYRGSGEEVKDLKELYLRFKGDMNMVFNYQICSDPEVDSHRFKDLLEAAIAAGELRRFQLFGRWAASVERMPRPADPLKLKSKKGKSKKGDEGSSGSAALLALISGNERKRADALFDSLATKYLTSSGGGKKRRKEREEPSEEEFEAARRRVEESKARGKVEKGV